jgi:hypothetical protein
MKKTTTILKILALLPLAFAVVACNSIENETQSASVLIIESILGTDLEGNDANYLESDVLYVDADGNSSVYNDAAILTVTARLLDPLSVTGPSYLNAVTLEHYVVSYPRSDGRNTQGVDVPYTFEGKLTSTISIDSTKDVAVTIVRIAGKIEPPLVNLAEGRDEAVITALAKIEVYGRDMVGKVVKASGYLTIHFANFINEAPSTPEEPSSAQRGPLAERKFQ